MKRALKVIYKKYPNDSSIYDVEGNKKQFSLKASKLDNWTNPGKTFLSLEDDGNGVSLNLGGKQIRLDYMDVELVRLALLINGDKINLTEITIDKFKGLE